MGSREWLHTAFPDGAASGLCLRLRSQLQEPGLAGLQTLDPLGWEGHGKECASGGFTHRDEAVVGSCARCVCPRRSTFLPGPTLEAVRVRGHRPVGHHALISV